MNWFSLQHPEARSDLHDRKDVFVNQSVRPAVVGLYATPSAAVDIRG
jgi:hypothetical protein